MHVVKSLAGFGAVAILLAGTVEAEAHAHLVTATPAAKATVASPASISIAFNETLEAKFSGFEITNAAGAKIATAPVMLDPQGKKTLSAAQQAPLAPGSYKIAWHVVGGDGHKVEGAYDFTVK